MLLCISGIIAAKIELIDITTNAYLPLQNALYSFRYQKLPNCFSVPSPNACKLQAKCEAFKCQILNVFCEECKCFKSSHPLRLTLLSFILLRSCVLNIKHWCDTYLFQRFSNFSRQWSSQWMHITQQTASFRRISLKYLPQSTKMLFKVFIAIQR